MGQWRIMGCGTKCVMEEQRVKVRLPLYTLLSTLNMLTVVWRSIYTWIIFWNALNLRPFGSWYTRYDLLVMRINIWPWWHPQPNLVTYLLCHHMHFEFCSFALESTYRCTLCSYNIIWGIFIWLTMFLGSALDITLYRHKNAENHIIIKWFSPRSQSLIYPAFLCCFATKLNSVSPIL